ncbi:calmodulin-regulated spectrin-associated protein 1a [Genypterus blacodes]|uniref:calmodulin-regulated spectrin-associated protein 1a n=1 Tax=Genypterus blacodes TaxID=154954 RepID=UPI003F765578
MDVEVSAARDSPWRRGADPAQGDAGGVMEIQVVPLEHYDSARAKIDADLRWLFAKAYGIDHIPVDLRDPFYTDQYEQEHIKPPIIRLLLSGELYCRVCGLILRTDQAASLKSHQSVMQVLSRKGILVLESDNTPVSDMDLSASPIKMNSHIHLIDSLMMAYTVEMISIEKVVASVTRFSNFNVSKELPYDLEDAMVFWINKVNMKMREITDKELRMKQHLLESPSHQKVRYRRDHLSGRSLQHFPLVDDLLKDVCDGTALLAVIHFYCTELIRLEDICLKEVPSITDSVYNIHLLMEFSNEYLNKCLYLKLEDMLYSPPVLKSNIMVFIAELFWWFEVVKPDFVQPRDLQEIRDVRLLLQPKSSRPQLPVSSGIKRNFLTTSNSADVLTTPPGPDLSKPTSPTPSHSFMSLRQRQQKMNNDGPSDLRNRSNSVTQRDGQHQSSILSWPKRRSRPLSQPVPYALHFPPEDDGDSISLARSISKDSLASNILSVTPKHMLGSVPQLPQHRLPGQSLMGHIRIEDEEEEVVEEELVAVIHPAAFPRPVRESDIEQDELEIQNGKPVRRIPNSRRSPCFDPGAFPTGRQADCYYLEPLMPAVCKQAKEKSISLNKEEESGERRTRKMNTSVPSTSQRRTHVAESILSTSRPPTEGAAATSRSNRMQTCGFFLHSSGEQEDQVHTPLPGQNHSAFSAASDVGNDSDSDIADLEEDEEDEELSKELERRVSGKYLDEGDMFDIRGEVESAKLREDLKVSERDDKEDGSGRSSPCLSTISWGSSCSASGSSSVRMTSFAERKLHKIGFCDGVSSTSSSQKTTPDGSETTPYPFGGPWRLRSDDIPCCQSKEPGPVLGKDAMVSAPAVPSELVQLHMKLEEQRRAIEYQKKKMETLSARHRLKLGKAAFLNIVKKGGGKSDTLPQPLKHPQENSETTNADRSLAKTRACRDDSCLEALRLQSKAGHLEREQVNTDNRLNTQTQDNGSESDLGDCSRSIEILNDAISSIQQQMTQLSLKQDLLMKRNTASPPGSKISGPPTTQQLSTIEAKAATSDSRSYAVAHFIDFGGNESTPVRHPPKLSSSQRTKTSDSKQTKDTSRVASVSLPTPPPQAERSKGSASEDQEGRVSAENPKLDRKSLRSTTFRVQDDPNQQTAREVCFSDKPASPDPPVDSSSEAAEADRNIPANSGEEAEGGNENSIVKAQLIEVDLSDLKDAAEDGSAEGNQKNVLGFFFKDEEKAEDEMVKRRAAFLLKQQRKAAETRLRKQQQEGESEAKRDEARRKAEEERIRKEEEKARREIIKQEYLRRKQQELMEEQGQVKPRPRAKTRRNRPKSLHRDESNSLSKGSTRHSLKRSLLPKAQVSAAGSRGADLSCSHRGSTLSLATEADSVMSGGAESQRAASVCSMESFPIFSRGPSRNMERDWENGSISSSINSIAEYHGPKLFKEPSSKSNKPIIINAIAHCCLAGKVNETQKNVVLEELEKCESNHLILLFRDGGCQFRAIYSYSPDTEEIVKFTGTGPRSISPKMIDKLFKYSSDRKQFTVIPAKSVSVSVDALTIHNYLWQVKRLGSSRRK